MKLAVLFASAFVAAAFAASQDQRVFRANVSGVTIPASVRSGGKPVPGLKAEDFELRDNGVLQEIRTFTADTVPLDVTLMLDASASVEGPLLERLKTAVNDTANLLHQGDRLRLISISQVLREVFPFRPKGEPMPLDALTAEGATSLYDALAAGMMRPGDSGRRQLVIAFTDGRDSTSILDIQATREIARLSDAVVDIVLPANRVDQPPDRPVRNAARQQTLDQVLNSSSNVIAGTPTEVVEKARAIQAAKNNRTDELMEVIAPTTGQVFPLYGGDSIGRAFRRVLDDFRASYVLQYEPQGVATGGWHDVIVTIRRPGRFDVRARKGYQG